MLFYSALSDYHHRQVSKYFSLADKDGDGQITKAEWFKVLNTAGVPTTMSVQHCQLVNVSISRNVLFRREVDGFFKILDKDLDGKLSFSEFLGEESHIERIFRTMDKNNDGFVSKEVG